MRFQCDDETPLLLESASESSIPAAPNRFPRRSKVVGSVVLVVAALAVCTAAVSYTKHGGVIGTSSVGSALELEQQQNFLETYYDQSNIPVNTHTSKDPFIGKVVQTKRIVGPAAHAETCSVVIDHKGEMPYHEGQSIGVIPPGVDEKKHGPHSVRLYEVASSRYGDDQTGKTMTLVVRRQTYWDPKKVAEDPEKKGVCSNYLCDSKPGDELKMTGPAGKVMLLPEDPNADIIMVATGVGIAPFRSFLRRIFVDKDQNRADFKGLAWLFNGVANSDSLNYEYEEEFGYIQGKKPDSFRYEKALRDEQTNKNGGNMYVQDKLEENADEIFERMHNGAYIYFCGFKGMMPDILEMFGKVAGAKGLDFDEYLLKQWKKEGQWHVEVY